MANLRVQKYGGSSLDSITKIQNVAAQISNDVKKGDRFLIIVSAMGKTTDDLVKMAQQISPEPNQRELDMLLTAGERISMALMSLALNHLGTGAISFTGSQAGILTSSTHGNAEIIDVKPVRVNEELEKNRVVILAGFQGVDPKTKEITTLGRGGSDTTAIAMAAHFKCAKCEFKKDTEGVFTADPHSNPKAIHHKTLSWDEVVEMTKAGAPFLHYKAAILARDKKMPLEISHAHKPDGMKTIVS